MSLSAERSVMAAADPETFALRTASLGSLHLVGILAALTSAAIHLLLGVRLAPSGLGISFVLAGLGFVGAVVLVLLDHRRRTVYAVGIPFTLVQVALWYLVNFANGAKSFPGDVGALGAVDKVAQVVLLVVLVALLR
jgi:succinate dehydrogenase/fumarate reductase cytochrome b subunit